MYIFVFMQVCIYSIAFSPVCLSLLVYQVVVREGKEKRG